MQKDKGWQREMTTIFEGIFLYEMVFSVELSFGVVSFDDFGSNLLNLKFVVY